MDWELIKIEVCQTHKYTYTGYHGYHNAIGTAHRKDYIH